MRHLSKEQERVLLYKYSTGDFPGQKWSTVRVLLDKGLLLEDGKLLLVTRKGADYCNRFHMVMA